LSPLLYFSIFICDGTRAIEIIKNQLIKWLIFCNSYIVFSVLAIWIFFYKGCGHLFYFRFGKIICINDAEFFSENKTKKIKVDKNKLLL